MSTNKFVQQDSNGPDVYFLVIPSAWKHLRRPVKQGSSDCEHVNFSISPDKLFGSAEIDYFDGLGFRVIKNILRFQVSMAYVSLMQVFYTLQQLVYNILKLLDVPKFYRLKAR